ncbi:putative qde-2-interacting protein [Neofusicoccum parvum UCRNP2]|uniref:Putative qde-2-interacting protein n=1 Tax=Botryosphaeria parva (strain UCR-NP2) TaxID=1287680 RepID=R1EGM6_BOTPV|nr:putative qde-2-interacting protein [Neofusicoccum parvum UCRNP2]
MPSSRAQRLLGLLNDDILALPKAPSPEPEPPAPVNPGNHQLANNTAQASRAWEGSPEPDSTPVHSSVDQKISALAEALDLDDRASSPSLSESSHEPDPYDDRPSTCLHRGDRAPWGEAYVSIQVASKFPYKFLNRAYSDQVAKKFFDRNQFWNRDWELYYVWPPADLASKPLILISLTQFQLLINEINQYKRNIDFRLADHHRDCGLIIDIDHPEFTPRFLGYSSSREDYNDMESRRVPPIGHRAPGEPTTPAADKPTLEAFKAKIEEAIILNKAKNKAAKAKRKEQRVNSQQNWGRLLKRTQRYFGLRPAKDDKYNPLADPTLNWAELQAAEAARKLPPVDFEKPAPFVFDKNVIFISVDIEAFELDNSKITEVGVATLDVLDIINIPPGKDGTNWHNKIRARHFRIDEHSHLENYRHVAGCAGGFEFGKSEFVRLAEAPQAVASCFKPPFSADLTPAEAEQLWAANASGNSSPSLQGDPSIVNADGKRNLIFVGHDPNQDIKFLQRLGYNPLNLSNLVEVIDTKLLHQHWKRDTQGTSLGKILADLDIIGWKLHNGGNDAVYTLQALVSLGIREASSRGSKELEEQRKHDHQRRMSEAIAEVVAKVSEEADGWSSMEEADDGGAPELAKPAAELEAADSVPPAGHVSPNATDCVFVGNLPYRATPEDVVAFFAKYGTITDVHLPINQATGATKGVGYVSYRTAAEAQNALEKCKNIEFWSRPIRVSMAPPREKKGGRGGNGNSGRNTPIPRNTPVRITDPVQSNPNYKGKTPAQRPWKLQQRR